MTHRRGRRSPSAALSASLVLAVAVMHILVVGCVVAGAMSSMSSQPHSAHDEMSVMAAGVSETAEHIAASASDCVMGAHGCVFVRADVLVLVAAVGLVLAIAPLRTAVATRLPRRAVVLGRPPPWAVLDHLQLSVIRR